MREEDMINIYQCGYDLRVGYTEGFNDGLTGKANEHELPETEWKSADRLDAKKDPDIPRECIPLGPEQEEDVITGYYKTGYNWGWMHGLGVRDKLKNEMVESRFERSMGDFAMCMKILYLQINKERYLVSITSLDPEEEKAIRNRFIDLFIKDNGEIRPDMTILQEIKTSLSESKLQRAIDKSVNYFRDQKDLGNFSFALSLKSKLIHLRHDSGENKIEKEEYLIEKKRLGDSLMERIETSNHNTDLT